MATFDKPLLEQNGGPGEDLRASDVPVILGLMSSRIQCIAILRL